MYVYVFTCCYDMLFVDSFPHLDIYLIKEAMILLLNKIASNMACWVFLLQRRTTRNTCAVRLKPQNFTILCLFFVFGASYLFANDYFICPQSLTFSN